MIVNDSQGGKLILLFYLAFAHMLKLFMAVDLPIKHEPRTIKQRKWVKEYIKTGNATEAARVAYNGITNRTAQQVGFENASKLDITAIFDRAGLTDARIANTLYRAMRAKRSDGKPDWLPRLKASEMALKVRGHFKERIEHMGAVGVYPILGGLSAKTTTDGAENGVVVSGDK